MSASAEMAGNRFIQGSGKYFTARLQILAGEGGVWYIGSVFVFRSHRWNAYDAAPGFYRPSGPKTNGLVWWVLGEPFLLVVDVDVQ